MTRAEKEQFIFIVFFLVFAVLVAPFCTVVYESSYG